MAPKASHLTISAKAGPPTVSKDGASVVVKKNLGGATLVETFPKHRLRGKTKQVKQLIPVEDVVRAVQEAEEHAKRKERAEGDRKVALVQGLANRYVDEKLEGERARTRFQKGKTVAAKQATKAAKGVTRSVVRQVNESSREMERVLGSAFGAVSSASEAILSSYNE
jgi:F0F1-type ATP synthase gamma subunit